MHPLKRQHYPLTQQYYPLKTAVSYCITVILVGLQGGKVITGLTTRGKAGW